LLDVARLFHALRPEGLAWPPREDGKGVSFKLEHLAVANGVRDGEAHEALSDVRATLGIARQMRQVQPRLWEYAMKLRDKRFAASLLDTITLMPVLHVSQMFAVERLCAAPVLPLARHPRIDSRVIVFDLQGDIEALLELDAQEIADRLYTPAADLPEEARRVPLKEIHTNRCPALMAWNHLREADFARLRIDSAAMETAAARLRPHAAMLAEKVRQVFAREAAHETADADAALYEGFIGDGDKRKLAEVRSTPPEQLGVRAFGFHDARLPELLFRYRARNWPETLDMNESARWDEYRRSRLLDDSDLSEFTLPQYFSQIAQLRVQHVGDGYNQILLDQLEAWGRELQ
jgi:exodeoxyribonuclease-1